MGKLTEEEKNINLGRRRGRWKVERAKGGFFFKEKQKQKPSSAPHDAKRRERGSGPRRGALRGAAKPPPWAERGSGRRARGREGERENAGGRVRASPVKPPWSRRPSRAPDPGQPPYGWGVPGSNPIGVTASPRRAAGQLQARLARGEGRKEGVREGRFSGRGG